MSEIDHPLKRLMAWRCGSLDADTTARVQQLDQAHLLSLAEALLDFHSVDDLEQWLSTYGPRTNDE